MNLENLELKTKQEIAEILNVKLGTIRSMESRKVLERKLEEKGYKLISKQKYGKTYKYEVIYLSQDKESLNNCIQSIFNTSNNDNIKSDYIMYRVTNIHRPLTRKHLSNLCNISEKTISRWDGKMIEGNLLAKDGYFYIAMDFIDEDEAEYRLTDKYEYSQFIKNNIIIKQRKEKMALWKENKIDDITFQIFMDGSVNQLKTNYGKIVYRVSKFSIGKNKDMLELIKSLIKKVYNREEDFYKQDWLEEENINNKTDYTEEL